MIDTHAHLDFENFDEDREEVISRAFDSGVKAIINVGVDLERSRKSVEIAEAHDGIFAAVGFHPEFFNKHNDTLKLSFRVKGELRELAKGKKTVAIGETGLDYFSHTGEIISDKQKENQKKGFLAQIELARELNLPVVVHCREAWSDVYEIISKVRPFPPALREERGSLKPSFSKFVLHCYSGEKKDTEKFLELPNVYFSFSGNITYPKPMERAEKLFEAVQLIPLDRIMLDSDCPFLAPQEMRGKRNEPMHIRYIAEKIAEIKEISVEQVERVTDENAERFFKINTNKTNSETNLTK